MLAKLPSEIQLHDVLSTLEGDLTIVDPPSPSAEESLYRQAIRMGLYQKIDAAVLQTLGSLTLEKILSKKNLQNLF